MKPVESSSHLLAKLQSDSRLSRLLSFLEANYADPGTNLRVAARHCGMSVSSLNDHLKQLTGLTFRKLLNWYRVEQAVAMMTTRNTRTLLEIGLECGFGSQANFIRQFKLWRGCRPSEHRRKVRAE